MAVHAPSNTSPETAGAIHAEPLQPGRANAKQGLVITTSLVLIAAMLTWALTTFQSPTAPYGGRAAFLFPLLILLVELGARRLAQGGLWHIRRALEAQPSRIANGQRSALPQITLPLYLACAVLLGAQIAVLAALFIETALQVGAIIQQPRAIAKALYRVATDRK